MVYLVYEYTIDKSLELGWGSTLDTLENESILFVGEDKSTALSIFDDALHNHYVITNKDKLELKLIAFNSNTVPGKLATKLSCFSTKAEATPPSPVADDFKLLKQILADVKKAEYVYTLNHNGINPLIRLTCAACGREITTILNKNITLTGRVLCDACWSKYLTTEQGLAEYYLAIAMGKYSMTAFSTEELLRIVASWEARKRSLINAGRFTEEQINGITAAAKAIGLDEESLQPPAEETPEIPDAPAPEPEPEPEPIPNGLRVTMPPNKVDYKVGEYFDPTGMEVVVFYDNGTSRILGLDECSINTNKALTIDDSAIYILYIENNVHVHAEQAIRVTRIPVELQVANLPNKVEYVAGEHFDPDGIVLEVSYEDGSTKAVNIDDCIIDLSTSLTVDTTTVRIYYFENNIRVSATCPITVKPSHALVAIAVTKQPNRLTYTLDGDPFDPSGMEVTAFYADNISAIVYNLEFNVEHDEDNNYYVIVSYTEDGITKTAMVDLDMRAEWVARSIRVVKEPDVTSFSAGQPLDFSGLVVEVDYADGTTKAFTNEEIHESANFTITADTPTFLVNVLQHINITYTQIWAEEVVAEVSTYFRIVLSSDYEVLEDISVDIDNIRYNEGDIIQPEDVIVRASYKQYISAESAKITRKVLASDAYVSEDIGVPLTPTKKQINVTYTENYRTASAFVLIAVAAADSGGSTTEPLG